MTYASTVLADTPTIYWRLGEASGTTATDASGNGLNGTYSSSPTLGVAGLLSGDSDTAMSCPSNFQAASITHTTAYDATGDYTVEIWVKSSSVSTAVQVLANQNSLFSMRWNSGTLEWRCNFNTSGTVAATYATNLRDGNPHHLVGVKNSTGLILYVDGVQVATASNSSLLSSNTNNMQAGGDGSTHPSLCTVDEFAYYKSALSATRVAAHHTAGSTSTKTGTASAALGGLTSTATGVRTTTGTAAAAIGGMAATASGVRTDAGTASAPLGGLAASATASAPEIDGTAAAPLGGITAAASGVRTDHGTASALLGALAATATGVRTDSGTAAALLGALTSAATGAAGGTGVALADLGALIAAAVGTVTGVIVAPAAGPFKWGFTMHAPGKALIPVEAGLDFVEWGFVMLQPGDALIGDPA